MIRIKDIAEKAGVSPTTVSNVIHGNHKKVSRQTVEKIEKLLEEMEYIPSMGATMLAKGKSHIIGVLIGETLEKKYDTEGLPFNNVLIRSLESEIYKRNYYMLLHFTSSYEDGIQFITTWNVEGLITIGFTIKDNEKIQDRCKIPMISIDTYFKEQKIPTVGLDDKKGGYLMAEHLIKLGHKKIAFLSINDSGVDHERWEGICLAYRKYLPNEEKIIHIPILDEKRKGEKYYENCLLELSRECDALFFTSDYYAMDAIARLSDMGIQVPDDISVAGFDDSENAVLCRPKLTTIHQNMPAKAILAVDKLFKLIDGQKNIPMSDILPVSLVIRDSVKNR